MINNEEKHILQWDYSKRPDNDTVTFDVWLGNELLEFLPAVQLKESRCAWENPDTFPSANWAIAHATPLNSRRKSCCLIAVGPFNDAYRCSDCLRSIKIFLESCVTHPESSEACLVDSSRRSLSEHSRLEIEQTPCISSYSRKTTF